MPKYLKYDEKSKAYVPDKAPKDKADSAPRPAALNVDTIDQDGVHPTIAPRSKTRRTRSKKAVVIQE